MIAICIPAALLLITVLWFLISSGTIRTYSEEGSLSEKFVMDINGAPNGFFINSKDTDNPVLLFVSSGPGTDDYVFTEKYPRMNLEEEFTVVYWDYRWMGIAYDSDADVSSITLDALIEDAHEVTGYLKERFNKEQIYIMGFSGGTHIALRTAERYPEDYVALINMAQVVTDTCERDTIMYEFMKGVFEERGDEKSLNRLESSVERIDEDLVKCKSWYDYVYLLHEAGGGTIMDKTEFEGITLPIITCRCYTVGEKIGYVRGMKMYRTTPLSEELENFDYRNSITKLGIPVYLISGAMDYNCPWELVEEYYEVIDAPDKDFYLIYGAAHSPLWENSEVTCEVLKAIKERTQNG